MECKTTGTNGKSNGTVRLPNSLAMYLVSQLVITIFFAGTFYQKMTHWEASLHEFKQEVRQHIKDRYTAKDAEKDLDFVHSRIDSALDRIERLEKK